MRIVGLLLFVPLFGCSKSDTPESQNVGYEIAAQNDIKGRLNDPDSAQFTGLRVVRRDGKVLGVCGHVNSKNGFGGMSGPVRFISGGATAIEGDGLMDAQNFESAWSMICA